MKLCCVEGCSEKGYCPLYCVEGEFWIKGRLQKEIPETWVICERHFLEAIPKTKCCIEGCNKIVSPNKIRNKKNILGLSEIRGRIRHGCRHRQMCVEHFQKFCETEAQPTKRRPSRGWSSSSLQEYVDQEDDEYEAPDEFRAPQQKNQQRHGTPTRACWHAGCSSRAEVTLRLPRPFQVYACKQHATKTDSGMRPAIAQGLIASPDAAENGLRDSCCSLCLKFTRPGGLLSCTAPRCPFAFCWQCVDRICEYPETSNATPDSVEGGSSELRQQHAEGLWRCWVCMRCETLGRPRERESWLQQLAEQVAEEYRQGSRSFSQFPQVPVRKKHKHVEQASPPTMEGILDEGPSGVIDIVANIFENIKSYCGSRLEPITSIFQKIVHQRDSVIFSRIEPTIENELRALCAEISASSVPANTDPTPIFSSIISKLSRITVLLASHRERAKLAGERQQASRVEQTELHSTLQQDQSFETETLARTEAELSAKASHIVSMLKKNSDQEPEAIISQETHSLSPEELQKKMSLNLIVKLASDFELIQSSTLMDCSVDLEYPKSVASAGKVPATVAIYHLLCFNHKVPDYHIEQPARLKAAILQIRRLHRQYPDLLAVKTDPPEVSEKLLSSVHDPAYLKAIEDVIPAFEVDDVRVLPAKIIPDGTENCQDAGLEGSLDTFVSCGTMQAVKRAAGAVCEAIKLVVSGTYKRAFCAVRPPGHHAGRNGRTAPRISQGFCIINNVAIGARYAVEQLGCKRVAVVDLDVHHGNGTQELLQNDCRFLFCSLHVFDSKDWFYPGTGGPVTAKDPGPPNVLNVPLKPFCSSTSFKEGFTNFIIPALEKYKPDLMILSSGFDGHKDDPTQGMKLVPYDYHVVTTQLMEIAGKLCQGRMVSVLEGGYDVSATTNALGESVQAHLMAILELDV